MSDADILIASMFTSLERYDEAGALLEKASNRLKKLLNIVGQLTSNISSETTECQNVSITKVRTRLADALAWSAYNHFQAEQYDQAITLNKAAWEYYDKLAAPSNWRAYFSAVKREFDIAEIYELNGEYNKALEIAQTVEKHTERLIENDRNNPTWLAFQNKVKNMKSKMEKTNAR